MPYDKFTILDSSGNKVDYDSFRPKMGIKNKQERIFNHVQIPVRFEPGQHYQIFTVRKDKSDKPIENK